MIKLTQPELNLRIKRDVYTQWSFGRLENRERFGSLVDFDLRFLDLTGINFERIYRFSDCDIRNAYLPSPTKILQASFYHDLSEELTAELMLYDAVNHPDRKSFDVWVNTGSCPFHKTRFQRAANFSQKSNLWDMVSYKKNALSAYQLVIRLFKEKNIQFQELTPNA